MILVTHARLTEVRATRTVITALEQASQHLGITAVITALEHSSSHHSTREGITAPTHVPSKCNLCFGFITIPPRHHLAASVERL